MPAGSVRLPELRQEIKVDTKDLQRAEAAAKRFRANLDRELRGNHNITVEVKGNFDRLRQQLKSFDGEVTANVRGDFTKLRDQLKAFDGETEARVSGDLTRLKQQLKTFDGEVEVEPHLNFTKLKAELKALSAKDLQFDADTTKATAKIAELKTMAEAVTDKPYELKIVIKDGTRGALDDLVRSTQIETTEISKLNERLAQLTSQLGSSSNAQRAFGTAATRSADQVAAARAKVEKAAEALVLAQDRVTSSAEKEAVAHERVTAAEIAHERSGRALEAAMARVAAVEAQRFVNEDQLAAAVEARSRAEENHATATARYFEAENRLNAVQRDRATALRNVVAAEQNVTSSHERVAEALRRSEAESTRAAGAHRNLVTSLRGVASGAGLAAKAIGGLGIAGTIAGGIGILGGAAVGLGSALTGAAPAALGLAGAIGGLAVTAGGLAAIFKSNEGLKGSSEILKQAFQGIQDDLQRRVNPAIIGFMRSVAGLAPIAREMVPPFATAFNEIATMFSNLLKDTSFQDDLRTIVASGIRQFRSFGEAGRNAIQGIISLAAATGPFVERIAQGFVELTADFRDWVNEARRTGELNRLLETSTTIIQSLGRTVRDLAVGFKNLFTAADLSGFTAQVLNTLTGIAGDFRKFTAERQADLQAMFQNLGRQVEGLRPLIASLADGIRVVLTNIDLTPLMRAISAIVPELAKAVTDAGNAVARIAESAAPAVNSLLSLIRGLIPPVESIIKTVVTNVTQVVDAVRPGIQRFADMLASIGGNVIPVITGAARNLGAAFSAAMVVIGPVGEFLGTIIGLLGDMKGPIGVVLSAFLGWRVLQGIISGIVGRAEQLTKSVSAAGTGAAGAGQKVTILGSAVRSLTVPMAKAVVGTANLAKGIKEVATGAQTMATSSSGLLQSLSRIGQGFTTGGQRATEFGASATRAGTAVTTAAASLSGSMSTALTGFGRSVQDAGTRLTGLAGNTTTTAQRMTSGLGGAVTTAGGLLSRLGETVGTVGTRIASGLGNATQTAAGHLSRFGSMASGVASAGMGALTKGVSGLSAALGGPWGIAIAGAITALSIFQQKSQAAEQAIQSYQQTMAASGGATSQATQQQIALNLANEDVFKSTQQLGVANSQVVSDVQNNTVATQEYVKALDEQEQKGRDSLGFIGQIAGALGKNATNAGDAADALRDNANAAADAAQRQKDVAAATTQNNAAMTASQRSAQDVSTGFDKMKQSAGDTTKFVDGLSQALDGISGRSKTADEANAQFGESLRQMADAAKQGGEAIKIVNGDLDEQSASGKRAYDSVSQLRESTLQKAAADFQAAGGANNLQAATAAATQAINQGKQAMVDSLVQMGANRQEAQKYVDGLLAIPPEVMTKIFADPANAERIVEDWRRGQTQKPPVMVPVGATTVPMETIVEEAKRRLAGAPPAPAPIGADPRVFDEVVRKKMDELRTAPPTPAGVSGDTKPLDKDVGQAQTNIEGSQATLPVQGNLLVEQQVQAFVGRLNAYQAAVLPINANVAPGEQQALAWVARINAYAAAVLPINANVQPGETQALAWVGRINGFQGAIMPINVDYRPGEQTLLAWVDMIRGYTQAILPIYGDTTPLMNDVRNAIAQISRMRAIVPVYGQFMGVIGMPGGGGGIPGFANGAVVPNETGKVAEFFANGGMTAKDKATLKALSNVSMHDSGDLSQSKMAKGQGLTPMKGGLAQIIPPNSWRVIGDRMVDDEAYIPINKSQRSQALLAETAKRMGYALEKFAEGAVSTASASSNSGGSSSQGREQVSTSSSVVNNHTDAPLFNGDLNITVPQGTTPSEAFNEVNFQLRRMKTGGKYRRNSGRN